MALQDNATPGHCVVCGRRHRDNLCERCYRKYAEGGRVPMWLRAIMRDQIARGNREARRKRAGLHTVPLQTYD